jgi:Fe-S cluster biogenesis protein NfuA
VDQRSDRAGDCSPCADSNITLKEQVAKLDDMELVDKNEDVLGETSDEKSRQICGDSF